MTPDLETATVDEIMDELARRFPAVVLTYHAPEKNSNDACGVFMQSRGWKTTCIGLVDVHKAQLLVEIMNTDGEDPE